MTFFHIWEHLWDPGISTWIFLGGHYSAYQTVPPYLLLLKPALTCWSPLPSAMTMPASIIQRPHAWPLPVRIPRPLPLPSRRTSPPCNLVTSFRDGARESLTKSQQHDPAVSLASGPTPRPSTHTPSRAVRPSCQCASKQGRASIQASDPSWLGRLDLPSPSVSCPPSPPIQSPRLIAVTMP